MDKQLDAIGIGCRRCASSFLHEQLNGHPEISKPLNGVHYFSNFSENSLHWYLKQLPAKKQETVLMEYSVSYAYPEYSIISAKRIRALWPDVKLFVSVRNPIDRAFSDYLRSIRRLEIPSEMSFEDAIDTYPEFLTRGKFLEVIAPYFDFFPQTQIHVMFYDDLLISKETFLFPLYRFLNIEEYLTQNHDRSHHRGGHLKSPFLQSSLLTSKKILDQTANFLKCQDLWEAFKVKHMEKYKALYKFNSVETKMADSTRNDLYLYYQSDIEWLQNLTNRSLKNWK